MSTKYTIRITKDFHQYTDMLDDFDGSHAYLRIDNGLVKQLFLEDTCSGLSVTVRLPPEVFRILTKDIATELRRRGRPIDAKKLSRRFEELRRLAASRDVKVRKTSHPYPRSVARS